MGSLDLVKIRRTLGRNQLGTVAVETGTARGHGTRALARVFPRVITIELEPRLHEAARARLGGEGFTNIQFVLGASAAALPALLAEIAPEEETFFFLDAHWSGDASVDWARARWRGYGFDTAHLGTGAAPSGPEQCPLAEELSAIARYLRGPANILIDDAKNLPAEGPGLKDLEFPGEDWSHLTRAGLRAIVGARLAEERDFAHPSQWYLRLSPAADARG